MDRLSPLFARSVPSARVFYSGNLCQISAFEAEAHVGHVHLMRRGTMSVIDRHGAPAGLKSPVCCFSRRVLPTGWCPIAPTVLTWCVRLSIWATRPEAR